MTRAALSLALLLSVVLAAPAASQNETTQPGLAGSPMPAGRANTAQIGFDAVRPERLLVVTGESVTWTNESARVHTVTADDDSFNSGRLTTSQTFRHDFDAPGEAQYHCTLHPSIRGVVEVHDILLDAPEQEASPNHPFTFVGRAAMPSGTAVSIEAGAEGVFSPVASAAVGDDGRFAARVSPVASASYRAVALGVASPPRQLLVLDRRISLKLRRLRGRLLLRAKVAPAAHSGRIVLQLDIPERFGWWPVQSAKLGEDSSATFTLRTRRRLRARVRFTLADGATALATSRIVHVGRPRS